MLGDGSLAAGWSVARLFRPVVVRPWCLPRGRRAAAAPLKSLGSTASPLPAFRVYFLHLPPNGGIQMAQITRRNFVQASGALAVGARARNRHGERSTAGDPPDIGNLRAEKDIVFGKGGDMDMMLDVYHPPEGVTPKRMAIIHLFGGGFFGGNKNAGYIINDAKALGARGYTNISANYRLQTPGPVAGADSRREGRDPLDARERRPARHRAEQDRRRRLLGGRHALADGGRHERQAGVRGQRSARPASARTSTRASASIRSRARRSRAACSAKVGATPGSHRGRVADDIHRPELRADDLHPRHGRHDGAAVVEHRLLHQAARGERADGADDDPGRQPRVRQRRARRRRGHGAVDRSVPRSAVRQSAAVCRVRRRRRRPSSGRRRRSGRWRCAVVLRAAVARQGGRVLRAATSEYGSRLKARARTTPGVRNAGTYPRRTRRRFSLRRRSRADL